MSIVTKDDGTSRHVIILNKYGLVLSTTSKIPEDEQHIYDGEMEMVNQVGVRYEDLDTHIVLMTAIRNARKLGVKIEQLYRYRNSVGILDPKEILAVLTPLAHIDPYYEVLSTIGEGLMIKRDQAKVFPAPTTERELGGLGCPLCGDPKCNMPATCQKDSE